MNKKDGGPAYPVPVNEMKQEDQGWEDYPQGMTLRDRFAIEAMGALVSAAVYGEVDDYGPEEVASDAYDYADAMIAERMGRTQ